MNKVVNVLLVLIIVLSNMLFLSSCSECSNCNGEHVVTCNECEGECFEMEIFDANGVAFEVFVSCVECGGTGVISCPECPVYFRIIDAIKTKIDNLL